MTGPTSPRTVAEVASATAPPPAASWLQGLREAVATGAIVLFLVLAAHQAAKPLHLDNMDFPAVAAATAASGVPIYYRGENNREHSGLYHPPLYIYVLAGWFRVFGDDEAQVRMFGALCALLQGWLVLQIVKCLFGGDLVRRWRWLFWPVFLLHPYTLQGSAIADIDTTIYGPLLNLVVWGAIRLDWRDGRWRQEQPRWWELGLIAAALTVALWAKLTTVFLLFPLVGLVLVPRWGWWRAFWRSAAIAAAGLGGFALTYYAYGAATGLDIRYTFQFLRASALGPGRLMSFRSNAWMMVPFTLRWTGLLPWLGAALLLAATARAWWRGRTPRAWHSCCLLGLGLASFGYYCAQVQTFSAAPFKYTFPFWGLVIATPAAALVWMIESTGLDARFLGTRGRRLLVALASAGVVLAGACVGALLVRDLHVSPGASLRFQPRALWLPALLALAALAIWLSGRPRLRATAVALAGAALLLHIGLQTGIAVYQSRTDYSTTYDYGQQGLDAAAAFIRSRTSEQERISSMKDVGFRARRRYFENYAALYDQSAAARLISYWEDGYVSYIVFTEGNGVDDLSRAPVLRDWVAANATLVASLGHYRIYRPKLLDAATAPAPSSSAASD
jgi:hypothetical protein